MITTRPSRPTLVQVRGGYDGRDDVRADEDLEPQQNAAAQVRPAPAIGALRTTDVAVPEIDDRGDEHASDDDADAEELESHCQRLQERRDQARRAQVFVRPRHSEHRLQSAKPRWPMRVSTGWILTGAARSPLRPMTPGRSVPTAAPAARSGADAVARSGPSAGLVIGRTAPRRRDAACPTLRAAG